MTFEECRAKIEAIFDAVAPGGCSLELGVVIDPNAGSYYAFSSILFFGNGLCRPLISLDARNLEGVIAKLRLALDSQKIRQCLDFSRVPNGEEYTRSASVANRWPGEFASTPPKDGDRFPASYCVEGK